jgi:hypothetical protein
MIYGQTLRVAGGLAGAIDHVKIDWQCLGAGGQIRKYISAER